MTTHPGTVTGLESTGLESTGLEILPGLLTAHQLDGFRQAADALRQQAAGMRASTADFVLEAAGAGGWVAWQQGDAPVAGVLRSVNQAHRYAPALLELQRELDLADGLVPRLVGAAGVLVNSFLWAKPPLLGSEKPWHQDMAFAPASFDTEAHTIVTVWIAVDDATEENGCLQFVPGSHRHGLFPHTGDDERAAGEPRRARAVEPHVDPARVLPGSAAVSVPLSAGSAVAFDGLTLHRSAPNTTATAPRTAISFVYRVPHRSWGLSRR